MTEQDYLLCNPALMLKGLPGLPSLVCWVPSTHIGLSFQVEVVILALLWQRPGKLQPLFLWDASFLCWLLQHCISSGLFLLWGLMSSQDTIMMRPFKSMWNSATSGSRSCMHLSFPTGVGKKDLLHTNKMNSSSDPFSPHSPILQSLCRLHVSRN